MEKTKIIFIAIPLVIYFFDFGETGRFHASRDNQIADLKQKLDEANKRIELLNESSSKARIEAQEKIANLEEDIARLRRELDDRAQASNQDVADWVQRVQGLTARINQLLERYLPYECIKNIQNREFSAAAEKLELLKQNGASTADIVNQVYGGIIENVRLLNDFGKSISDIRLAMLVYGPLVDTLSRNTVNSHIYDFIDLFKSVENKFGFIPIQLLLGQNARETLAVKFKLRKVIKQAGSNILKDVMLNNTITTELNNAMFTIDSDLFFETISDAMEHLYDRMDTKKMFDYLRKFESLSQALDGYRALFYALKNGNNGDLHTEWIVELAFDIVELRKRDNYANVDSNIKDRFERLKEDLPKSLSALAFSRDSNVCLKNVENQEYLYASSIEDNKDRRKVFTSSIKYCTASWTIKRVGGHLSITNVNKNEHLYVSVYFNYRMFTYIANGNVFQNKWKIIPHPSGVRIMNLVYDGISIAAIGDSKVNGVKQDEIRNQNGIWEVEECHLSCP